MKKYVIAGAPVSLKRPRFSTITKSVYNSQKNQMLIMSINLASQHDKDPLFEGPVHLDITFFMPIPVKTPRKRANEMLDAPCFFKPDLSNLIKFLEDLGSGVLYKDDAIIASVSAKKVYSINPRTEFSISSLSENKSGTKKN